MLRAENLTVEVFVDEDDDGTRYAGALTRRSRGRPMVAHRLVPNLGQGW
jgi:hypothetical protein